MATLTLDSFLSEIDAFCGRTGVSATVFGKEVAADPNFVRDLRHGRMPGLRLIIKAHEFIAAYDKAHSSLEPHVRPAEAAP